MEENDDEGDFGENVDCLAGDDEFASERVKQRPATRNNIGAVTFQRDKGLATNT